MRTRLRGSGGKGDGRDRYDLMLVTMLTVSIGVPWPMSRAEPNQPTGPSSNEAIQLETPQRSTSGPQPGPGIPDKSRAGQTESGPQLSIPAYRWRHGCGPTALGMVIGYWDGQGFGDLVPGSAMEQTDAVDQIIASQRSALEPGHYEDYSLPVDTDLPYPAPDRSESPVGDEHADDCLADFMKTSFSLHDNRYGWSWSHHIGPAFAEYVAYVNPYYRAAWQQYRRTTGALSWAVLVREIDARRPMVFLVDSEGDGRTDHIVAVVGYRHTGTPEYACLDTWEPANVVRWCPFATIEEGQPWGIWAGWTFALSMDDCNGNGVPDAQDTADEHSSDCDDNHVPDECQVAEDNDGDGVLVPCDNCPDLYNPDQADADQDGLGDRCDAPWPVAIISLKEHGPAGPLSLALGPDVVLSECRQGGPTRLAITFNVPITATPDVPTVTLSSGHVGGLLIADRHLTIALEDVTPDEPLSIDLAGIANAANPSARLDRTVEVPVLLGDVTGEGRLDIYDLLVLRNRLAFPPEPFQVRHDLNTDGQVNIDDLLLLREALGREHPPLP